MYTKKKKLRAASLIAAAALVLSMSACVGNSRVESSDKSLESSETPITSTVSSTPEVSGTPKESSAPEKSSEASVQQQNTVFAGSLAPLTAEKVADLTLPEATRIDSVKENALIYVNNDAKYGILSLEGHDTGAVYTYCKYLGNGYFAVSSETPEGSGVEAVNHVGAVDVEGNSVIPEEYASLASLNDRYIKASKATEETDSEDDALIYSTDSWISLGPAEGDTLYKGTWCVFDTETKAPLADVTGTKALPVSAQGNWVNYYTDDEEKIFINDKGEPLPDGSTLFRDGSYSVKTESGGEVHDTDGNLLFTYKKDGYIPSSLLENGYYTANRYEDGTTSYVLLDRTGQVISAEFTDFITPYGDLFAAGEKMYDISGQDMWGDLAVSADSVNVDDAFGNCWCIRKGDTYKFVTRDGSIICEFTENEDEELYVSNDFYSNKRIDGDYYYYCFKDGDYTIPGQSFDVFTVEADGVNDLRNIIDTVSGETLLEGYDDYYQTDVEDGYLIYAQNGSTVEVYQIRQEA